MSIIYEALKKAEKNIDAVTELKKNKEVKASKAKPNPYLLLIFIACLTLYIANATFNFIVNAKKPLPPVAPPQEALPQKETLPPEDASPPANLTAPAAPEIKKEEPPPPPLVLNGIVYSQNEGYALINNRIVKIGDVVAGATVKRIDLNEVELESEGKIIKLSTP